VSFEGSPTPGIIILDHPLESYAQNQRERWKKFSQVISITTNFVGNVRERIQRKMKLPRGSYVDSDKKWIWERAGGIQESPPFLL